MTHEEFFAYVDDQLGRALSERGVLHSGLAVLDSLEVLEIFVLMEDMGLTIAEDLMPQIHDFDDLYYHYLTRVTAR